MMKLRRLLAVGATDGAMIALPVVMAAPASAATPGSQCTLHVASTIYVSDLPGTVTPDGQNCVPNPQIIGNPANLNAGLPCGFNGEIGNLLFAFVECPG